MMRRKKSIPRSPVRGGNFNLDVSHPDFLAGFGGSETEAQAAIAMLMADAKAAGYDDPLKFLDAMVSDADVIRAAQSGEA
jgi:hypothetical protein